jgi:hypothetical protein
VSILPTLLIPLSLIGLSGYLIDVHRRAWRTAEWDERLSERDRRFAKSQYRRRMQSSGLIGLIGAALGCYPLVPETPLAIAIYLTTLVAACFCIMLSGLLDYWATRQNLRRIHHEHLTEQIKLVRELQSQRAKSKVDRR